MKYLIYCSSGHPDFRKQELQSLAKLYNIQCSFDHSLDSPFVIVSLQNDEQARLLVSRSILVKDIYQLLDQAKTLEDLTQKIKSHPSYPFDEYKHSSFRFTFEAYNFRRSLEEQRTIINSFAHLGWLGKIDMKSPDHTFTFLEEAGRVFLARHIGTSVRSAIRTYDLKKRGYIGTTSMESEMSLVTANQVLAAPGKLIYDPFVGTGSFLLTSSGFGATTLGSDIDGRQLRGKKGSIMTNFQDHDLSLLLDCLVFDVKHAPWHTNFKVDGIVTDPPYGVRAGAKTLGRPPSNKLFGRTEPSLTPNGTFVHLRENYVPPKKPYELDDLADDLLDYAATYLVMHGRLVFWLPTHNEDLEVPLPGRSDMTFVSSSTQSFGRWSRRLLTYEKTGEDGTRIERITGTSFRERYFNP